MTLVADASNHQRYLNLLVLSRVVDGVYHKATQGTGFVDPYFHDRHRRVKAYRLPFGAYHFAGWTDAHGVARFGDPQQEARHFLSAYHELEPTALQPALDIEIGTPDVHMAEWAIEWCRTVERELRVWPLVYSYGSFLAGLHVRRPIGGGLWLASYGRNDGVDHAYFVPHPWRRARMHQFTSVGKLAGIPMRIDLSHTRRLPFAHPLRARLHRR